MSIAEKLTKVADNVTKVFDAGKDAGKDEEHRSFWEVIEELNNQKSPSFAYAFARIFDGRNFKPTVMIKPATCTSMFYVVTNATNPMDFVELAERGVGVDFSQCTDVSTTFYQNNSIVRLPIVDLRSASSAYGFANGARNLWYIEKMILKDGGTQTFVNTFTNANSLSHIRFEGTIGRDISFASCPLDAESAIDAINHLANYAGTSNEYAYTFTLSDGTWEVLEAHSVAPNGGAWRDYVTYSLGWNT